MAAAVVASTAVADGQSSTNPLLADTQFPLFDKVAADDVVPGMKQLLAELETDFAKLEKSVKPTWEGLVEPLERLTDRLQCSWGTVSHLKSVKDTEALRSAYEEIQPLVVDLSLKLGQSRPLYEAFLALKAKKGSSMTEAQLRVVDAAIKEAELNGVGLEGEAKEKFNEIEQELSKLSTKFSNNLLDSTKAFTHMITDPKHVEGLPASARGLLAQQAKARGHEAATAEEGPWCVTLDMPAYLPVMQHATYRPLREKVYYAFISRASSGETDNTPIIQRILTLRKQRAELLGYPNHAEVSLATKMATLPEANELLEDLRKASYDAAAADLAQVKKFAAQQGVEGELRHWDMGFWSERLKESLFELKEEDTRPYFALPAVMDGLYSLATRLFGVTITRVDGMAPVWDGSVMFFQVSSAAGEPLAYFYLDPYSRPAEKRGGAWMDEVKGRSKLFAMDGQAVRLPVAHMVCNQSPPIGDQPSLMTFREVETLFHEFGHALQHMLTTQEEGMCSGIRGVEWDAVELPSQFMENWCYHKPTLMGMAKHFENGETMPDELYNKLVQARTFRAGSNMLRQLHFSKLDLDLHSRFDPSGTKSIYDLERDLAATTTVMPPLPEDRFLCGFGHIFAGGYSAGYYSYKWAEVLSADAFSAFEDAGLDDEAKVQSIGRKFRDTVLAMGGGKPPAQVFQEFRGRAPSTEPLLRHSGLAVTAAASKL